MHSLEKDYIERDLARHTGNRWYKSLAYRYGQWTQEDIWNVADYFLRRGYQKVPVLKYAALERQLAEDMALQSRFRDLPYITFNLTSTKIRARIEQAIRHLEKEATP